MDVLWELISSARNWVFPVSGPKSQLDEIIRPEIKHDAFYEAIVRLTSRELIKDILEIGSSCGEGSTAAFVEGIYKNGGKPRLFCMEVSWSRFRNLKKRYSRFSRVKCYRASSVPLEKFPSEHEVTMFYNTVPTKLNDFPLTDVLGWLREDQSYIRRHRVPQHGIRRIKWWNRIKHFDVVLIDGSEFTGMAELEEVFGAKFILLDDVNAFKNYSNRERLLKSHDYELVEENLDLRNGYSIFRRREFTYRQHSTI